MNVQHSSRTDEWGTPDSILDMVRKVLGTIDFDPASSAAFNERVKAFRFLDKDDDGLVAPWPVECNIFLNPPGGKIRNRSLAAAFWNRLVNHKFRHAIYMGFSLEQMQTTQASKLSICDFPFCVPRKRIAFVDSQGRPGPAPSHSNVIVYLPGTVNNTDLFRHIFSDVGVTVGRE